MLENAEANPAPVESDPAPTPETEAETQSEVIENEDSDSEESAETEEFQDLIANSEPELVEVEYEGDKVKVPEKIKDALMRQSDYTKKTMSLAEERQAFEAEAAKAKETWASDEKAFNQTVELRQIEQQLEQAKQIDWDAWEQANPTQAQRGLFELQQLQKRQGDITTELTEYRTSQETAQTEARTQARQAALDTAAKEIPNWSDDRRTQLETLGVELGVPKEVAGSIDEAWAYRLLHFASIGKEAVSKQKAAAKMSAAQAGEPIGKISGKSAAPKKSPEKMSDEEWYANRLKSNKRK